MSHQSQDTTSLSALGGQYLLRFCMPQPRPKAWWAAGVQSVLAKRGHLLAPSKDAASKQVGQSQLNKMASPPVGWVMEGLSIKAPRHTELSVCMPQQDVSLKQGPCLGSSRQLVEPSQILDHTPSSPLLQANSSPYSPPDSYPTLTRSDYKRLNASAHGHLSPLPSGLSFLH